MCCTDWLAVMDAARARTTALGLARLMLNIYEWVQHHT
jgi:hypothetical protein